MKRLIFLLLGIGLLASCSYRVYPVSKLQSNYDASMLNTEELVAKSGIAIYLNEKDVPGDYEVLSFVTYHPWFIIPIFYSEPYQQTKKFYKKAVLKAHELGGNAILVTAVSEFKVLSVSGIDNTDASASVPQNKKKGVSSVLLGQFEGGDVYKLEPKLQSKYVDMLKDEIKDDIDDVKTLDECAVITRKINALEKYYDTVDKKTKSINKRIEEYREDLDDVMKKIEKKAARKAKVENFIGNVKEKVNKKN